MIQKDIRDSVFSLTSKKQTSYVEITILGIYKKHVFLISFFTA